MKIFVTREIPAVGIAMLHAKGHEVDVGSHGAGVHSRPLSQKELIKALRRKPYDAVLSLLTDQIDAAIFDAAPSVKLYANYAVGFNNIDVTEAKKRGILITNTPGGGTDRVAEHAWALILALTCRVAEGDRLVRSGNFKGWDPMLLHGTKLAGSTLGIIGTGRIGADVARKAIGFGMKVIYYDVRRNTEIEKEDSAIYKSSVDEVLAQADVISIHVPLTPETHHLINAQRLALMKPTAYIVNTARGPIIDEKALVQALEKGIGNIGKPGEIGIRGAGLDVFEYEPELARGLAKLPNVVLTPHIASATEQARIEMAQLAAQNIIDFGEGLTPKNMVY